jgi:hypothetical protein
METLKIFISYATEDQNIADVLKLAIKTAFVDNVSIVMMSDFTTGLSWKNIIQKSIDETDVMIVIATGRLKPSHSFTGAEVGAFEMSVYSRPMMARWPTLQRRMIPFAVLARLPDTVNEYEGINIDVNTLRDVRFEPASLEANLSRLSREQGESSPNALKFLLDIQDILDARDQEFHRPSIQESRERISVLTDVAARMTKDVIGLILLREKDREAPKARLIIRTKPGSAPLGRSVSIRDTSIEFIGDFSRIFGPAIRSNTRYSWPELVEKVEYDIGLQWQKALQNLISSDSGSVYVTDNSIITFDSKKLYRVFISTTIIYYDDTIEFQVYAVELLHEKDIGDPMTSLLLHAVEISLGYRFMFLEDSSKFSAKAFTVSNPAELPDRTAEMLDYLVMLLIKSEQYKLADSQNILAIIGGDAAEEVKKNYGIWNHAKDELYSCAKSVLSAEEMSEADQTKLINTVKTFRSKTQNMNSFYTTAVIERLQKILAETEDQLTILPTVEPTNAPH